MNLVRLVTAACFIAAWLGGVTAWLCGFYHMVMFNVRLWQATPAPRGNIVKFLDLRLGWFKSDIPEAAILHRRKTIRWILILCGFVAVGFLDGMIGAWLALGGG